uniref:DUF7876 domain-containing protein n=1 Tax=Zea mays TaxID=4577 RepID=A0A804M3R4_MAIZE
MLLMLHETLPFVRPTSSCRDPKLSEKSASAFHGKLGCSAVCSSAEGYRVQKPHIVHSYKVSFTRTSHHLCKSLNERTTRHCLHRFHVNASPDDDDFRSSRNIAISLFKRYKNVIDRGGGENLNEFVSAGVTAYALGCTDEGLRKELMDIEDSGLEIEGLGSLGGTSLKFKVHSFEIPDVLHQWKGFCALIANAYYVKGMAWLPVKTLQLEQMAVTGSSEKPSVVASRMQLVFSTLEVVSPQWPRV